MTEVIWDDKQRFQWRTRDYPGSCLQPSCCSNNVSILAHGCVDGSLGLQWTWPRLSMSCVARDKESQDGAGSWRAPFARLPPSSNGSFATRMRRCALCRASSGALCHDNCEQEHAVCQSLDCTVPRAALAHTIWITQEQLCSLSIRSKNQHFMLAALRPGSMSLTLLTSKYLYMLLALRCFTAWTQQALSCACHTPFCIKLPKLDRSWAFSLDDSQG